jgi:hypothetical protein
VDAWDFVSWWALALVFGVTACGGKSTDTVNESSGAGGTSASSGGSTSGSSGNGGSPAGSGGMASGNGGTTSGGGGTMSGGGGITSGGSGGDGGAAASGGACDPVFWTGIPDQPGCYHGTSQGWEQVPCVCDVALSNSTHAVLSATLALTFTPDQPTPSLTDLPDVEIVFADGDETLYGVWSKQAELAGTFSVTAADGSTTVRLAASSVVLDPVAVAACQTVTGEASVSGTNTELRTHATFADAAGNVMLMSDGTCANPVPL